MSQEYSVEEFWTFDLRVGLIIEAEKVVGSQKLLKLTVDFGNELRTIVTGVADQHDPSEFKAKKMVFVTNLKAKKVFGVESKGMLLLAEDANKQTYLVEVRENVPVGSRFY
ncbi:MAG: methionine--tRNA ligase subunit beta [Nitrososphaeria archaeon]